MPAVQYLLSFARPLATRVRSVRRPFRPPAGEGRGYRLPHDIHDRLASSLAPFRNREAALALAVFLGRFWSSPGRIVGSFPIDRRALADHAGLDLTEARVRGAIKTLEAVGFLDRALTSGSTHKATPDGLRRKPVLFVFGSEYAPAFMAANKRAGAARGRQKGVRRSQTPDTSPRLSVTLPGAQKTISPISRSVAESPVLMGEVKRIGLPPSASEPSSNLEAALERLKRAIGEAGIGSGERLRR